MSSVSISGGLDVLQYLVGGQFVLLTRVPRVGETPQETLETRIRMGVVYQLSWSPALDCLCGPGFHIVAPLPATIVLDGRHQGERRARSSATKRPGLASNSWYVSSASRSSTRASGKVARRQVLLPELRGPMSKKLCAGASRILESIIGPPYRHFSMQNGGTVVKKTQQCQVAFGPIQMRLWSTSRAGCRRLFQPLPPECYLRYPPAGTAVTGACIPGVRISAGG